MSASPPATSAFAARPTCTRPKPSRTPASPIAGIASAFLELDDLPTSDQRSATDPRDTATTLELSRQDADELTILGRWMANECSADAAVSRLSRKLVRLSGQDGFTPLTILNATLTANGRDQHPPERGAQRRQARLPHFLKADGPMQPNSVLITGGSNGIGAACAAGRARRP
ncbi:MAG: hypothetical protein R3D85_13185 [Paracoccaceae bacterium]